MFTVSINPSYFCNFRCDFCYLTPEQLGNQKKISLERLDQLLGDIPKPSVEVIFSTDSIMFL